MSEYVQEPTLPNPLGRNFRIVDVARLYHFKSGVDNDTIGIISKETGDWDFITRPVSGKESYLLVQEKVKMQQHWIETHDVWEEWTQTTRHITGHYEDFGIAEHLSTIKIWLNPDQVEFIQAGLYKVKL